MIYKFSVHRSEDESGPAHMRRLLPGLIAWKDYYLEVVDELSPEDTERFINGIVEPLTEYATLNVPLASNQVQVAYKRGIVDNENDSILALCSALGISGVAAKVAITYQSDDTALRTVVEAEALNATIEELHTTEPAYDSLLPQGSYAPAETFDLRGLDDDELTALGRSGGRVLDLDKMRHIQAIQNKLDLPALTDVTLEALDARWSDHCAHTTWKSLGNLLKQLVRAAEATENPNIVSMFYDNAGIWDFYDGYGIAIKAETHNGPCAVSAYFGQLTKLGGVLRDILGTGLGADPIGSFEYTATGLTESPSPVAGRPTPKRIANETIRAIKEYGNTFGVPMMWSHMTFNDDYRAKPFALGGSIGLIPNKYAQKGKPQSGDHLVLIGGLTGNDGIHGATGSSAGAVMDATSVQIGSPLEEIKFREAILDLRDQGCIRAVTDLGAAGLNSAVGEMGEGVGVWMNTALVPLKTGGLPMWRILLSESQERMILAIAPERLADARAILARHEVRNTVVGRFTGNDRYCVVHDTDLTEKHVEEMDAANPPQASELGFDLPYEVLDYTPPAREVQAPRQAWRTESEWPSLAPADIVPLAARLVRDTEVADQSFAGLQYDSSVQGRTFYGPAVGPRHVATGYYASRPLYGKPQAIVFNTSFNPWLFEAHPVLAARQHFLSVLVGQVLAGVALEDVCLCDNFYTPHMEPGADSWLAGMVHELADLSAKFKTPFISGKDSSAGSTETDEGIVSVPPAVFLSALGKVPHTDQLRTETWTTAGNMLVRVAVPTSSMAGTAAARLLDLDANDVDEVSPQAAYKFLQSLGELPADVAVSGRVIGAGGVLGCVINGALASDLAAELHAPAAGCHTLLQEHRVGALIEVPEDRVADISDDLRPVVVGRIAAGPASVRLDGIELLGPDVIDGWQTQYEMELA